MALRRKPRPRPTGWRRVRRWAVRSSGVLVAVVALLLVVVTILLANLDRPAVSDPLADYLRDTLGLEITYDTLHASMLSDIVGRNVRIASPEAVRAYAPDLLQIGSIDAHWTPRSLLGNRVAIEHLEVHGLRLWLVVDEEGKTTLDWLVPEVPQLDTPVPTPTVVPEPFRVSQILQALPGFLDIGKILVDGIEVTIVETENGEVVRRTSIKGLALEASLRPVADGPVGEVVLHCDSSRRLAVVVQEAGEDRARTWTGPVKVLAGVRGDRVRAEVVVALDEQSLVPWPLSPGDLVRLEAHARFLPEDGWTNVTLDGLELLGGAVRLEAGARLKDRTEGTVAVSDVSGLLEARLGPLKPFISLPETVHLGDGSVRVRVDRLALDPETWLPGGGTVVLEGAVDEVSWQDETVRAALDRVGIQASADLKKDLDLDLAVELPLSGLVYEDGATRLRLPRATLGFRGREAHLDLDQPDRSTGAVTVQVRLQDGEARLAGVAISGASGSFEARTVLTGEAPYAATARVDVDRLALSAPAGRYDLSGTHLEARLEGIQVPLDDVASARGKADLSARFGPLNATVTVAHGPGSTHWDLQARADDLRALGPLLDTFLSPGEQVAWSRLGLRIESQGRVHGLFDAGPLRVDQQATMSVRNLSYFDGADTLSVPALAATMRYRGTPDVGTLGIDARLENWRYGVLSSTGTTRAAFSVQMSLPQDRYHVLVHRYEGDLLYTDGLMNVGLERVRGTADLVYQAGTLNGSAELETSRIDYRDGPDHVWIEAGRHRIQLVSDSDIEHGVLEVAYEGNAERMGQNYTSLYPPVDISLDMQIRLAQLSAFSVDRFVLESLSGKTRLEAALAMDDAEGNLVVLAADASPALGGDQATDAPGVMARDIVGTAPITAGESLTLRGVLEQDLGALNGDPEFLSGRGRIVVPFRIESPDQVRYRLASTLEFHDVDLTVPDSDLVVEGFSGQCLVVEEFRDSPEGFVLVPNARRNAYTRASFPDTQPYLSGDSFFSIRRLAWADLLDAGPIAGNLRLDRNMVRLDQLQMGVAQGTVTGQLLVDYREGDTNVLFRGAANGLRLAQDSSERLDANIALAFALDKLDLNGRAHIVHIGRKTLLAMLDAVDPYHEDVDVNRVRLALKAGYPRFVRVEFDHGFMSLKIDLGGVAGTVRIDEIRGIAMGPILETYLGDLM